MDLEIKPELHSEKQNAFVKGMSLQQYMNNMNLDRPIPTEDANEQNLFQSSLDQPLQHIAPKKSQYFINQIDQESAQDSVQLSNHQNYQFTQRNHKQFPNKTPIFTHQIPPLIFKPKISTISMNETAYPKRLSNQKIHFRPKQMSTSPYNRKVQSALQNGSITLYGNKFGQSASKQASKIPQLITFYGKIQHQKQEPLPKQNIFKKTDSLRNFKKNNHLEIQKLIEFQNKIKNNYAQTSNLQNKKVESIKEKTKQRKGRF